ncbi:MAG: hypothetical protein DRH97_00185 [Chloroflexi bacterium]|nr:MAG: hypothetical protein DRH97_00185 [Chloroflexota bacterium]
MANCGFIKKKAGRVCAGSMDKYVEFFDRETVPSIKSFSTELKPKFKAFCSVETRRGVQKFDGTNTNRGPDTTVMRTHDGYSFEKKMIAKLNNKFFEIDRFENLNEDNRFIEVTCIELGDETDSTGDDNLTSLRK